MYLKKPDLKLKEGEKCRIASLLTSKRKCKQYFISKSSFFVLSCGSILYALSSAVLFAFTSSVSIHIYSPQGVSRNYFPYTTQQLPHSKGISVSPGQINWATRYFFQREISYTSFENVVKGWYILMHDVENEKINNIVFILVNLGENEKHCF